MSAFHGSVSSYPPLFKVWKARGAHHCRSPIRSCSLYSMKSSGARTRRQSLHVHVVADSMAITDSVWRLGGVRLVV